MRHEPVRTVTAQARPLRRAEPLNLKRIAGCAVITAAVAGVNVGVFVDSFMPVLTTAVIVFIASASAQLMTLSDPDQEAPVDVL